MVLFAGNVGVITESKNSVDVSCSISGVYVSAMMRVTDGTLYRNGTLETAAFDNPRAMMGTTSMAICPSFVSQAWRLLVLTRFWTVLTETLKRLTAKLVS